jgi:hypothetical protein
VANPAGELRPGMNATVRIEVPLAVWAEAVGSSDGKAVAASPSPRPSPGGKGGTEVLVVPERAVIDTGARQIVYVESKPGQFDGVEVQLGPRSGEFYPVLKGLKAGQRVAAAGAFLIDAETRLNPALASTYYGASGGPQSAGHSTSVKPQAHDAKHDAPKEPNAAARRNINKLPPADRDLALAQGACPITDQPLGSMGVPVKLVLKGQAVFLCCAGCTEEAQANPDKTLEKVARFKEARRAKKGQP